MIQGACLGGNIGGRSGPARGNRGQVDPRLAGLQWSLDLLPFKTATSARRSPLGKAFGSRRRSGCADEVDGRAQLADAPNYRR